MDFKDDRNLVKETPLKVAAKKLPVYSYKEAFLRSLDQNQSLIIVGETGSGKTTQIPQWCHEYLVSKGEPWSKLSVACTQPRRIAAISVATRVAEEMGVTLGQEVGYSVRFDSAISPKTILKYLTDGMLLREAMHDKSLKRYGVIIIDEAHERTLQTEILMGVVKIAQKFRRFKFIIMSATINLQLFNRYFPNSSQIKIPGRQHKIQKFYASTQQSDTLVSTLITVFQLHRTCGKGDILVFCSGQDEIISLVKITSKILIENPTHVSNLQPLPLYAGLPTRFQMKIFEPANHDDKIRRVIYATNVAETSITVPNIKYVIDTGYVKTKTFCPKTGLESLKVSRISKSQATQRSGRAGRIGPGECYRLYTQDEFSDFLDEPIPEIKRCNLDGVLLQLITIGIRDIESFDFLEKPDDDRLQQSLKHLLDLKAIKKILISQNGNGYTENGHHESSSSSSTPPLKKPHIITNGFCNNQLKYHYELTSLGKKLSAFPLSPSMSRVIIAADELGCVNEVLTVISLLYVENLFHVLPGQRKAAELKLDKFKTNEGDLIMFLKLFRGFRQVQEKAKGKGHVIRWCHEHHIYTKSISTACYVRKQLVRLCESENIRLSSCGSDQYLVRKAFIYGFVNNIARMWNGKYRNKNDQEIDIHPSSCLFKCRPENLMYIELSETNKCYMRNCSVIESDWIREALSSSASIKT